MAFHYNKTLLKFTPISIFDNCYSVIEHFWRSAFAVTLRPKLLDIPRATEKQLRSDREATEK
jgi:hypothetical protein